ncbi:MAG: hypothetical protein KC619_02030 [Myxococcales bacterium]|nr:hypothetical protein [Myxococcales bacterium]
MRKTWTILGALLVTLTFSTAAFAQDEPDTTYDFDDDDVEGSYRSPLGDILVVRPGASHSSLIQPRAHFVPELMKSIETI